MRNRRLRDQLVNVYLDAVPLVTLNLLWFVALFPVVTAFPATAGLFYATNLLAHGRSANWHDFLKGMRLYFWQSWAWGALNIGVFIIVLSNAVFYAPGNSTVSSVARSVVTGLAFLWLCLQVYTLPLLMEQERPNLRLAFRNSAVMLLKRPLSSVVVTLCLIAVVLLSTVVITPAWLVITASFCAYVANTTTIASIAALRGGKATRDESV